MTWTYVWDAENRLKWICNTTPCTEAGAVASSKYDPLGRRVEKSAGGVTTTYIYDDEDILRQIVGSSMLTLVHGPWIDEPLAQEDATGAVAYFHADGLGSVTNTTVAAGAVVSTRRYDAFGNLEVVGTSGFAFTGREWDTEAGLYYYRARYYDAKTGRLLSEDPNRLNGPRLPKARSPHAEIPDNRDGPNSYVYARNNPVVLVDPSGRGSLKGVWKKLGKWLPFVDAVDCAAEYNVCVEAVKLRCCERWPPGREERLGFLVFNQATCTSIGIGLSCQDNYEVCMIDPLPFFLPNVFPTKECAAR